MLREGELASAEIVSNTRAAQGHRAIVARVELPDGGQLKRSWKMPPYAPGAQAEPGEQLQALVGLGLSPEVILPAWVGARYAVPADIRPAAWPMADIPAPQDQGWAAALYAEPPAQRARRGWLRRLKPRARLRLVRGEAWGVLELEGSDGAAARVDLERPFRADLSVWLLPDGRADVTLSLHARESANVHDTPLRVKARLAQRAVARHLPLQETQAPHLDPSDFTRLWEALVYHGHLHGLELRRDLKPSDAPRADAPPSERAQALDAAPAARAAHVARS